MRQVVCNGCFRWTAVEANPNVAFWFLCWECLDGPSVARKEHSPTALTREDVSLRYDSMRRVQVA